VLISAALFKGSITDRALEKAQRMGKTLISESTLAELQNVISRSKFDKYIKEVDRRRFLIRYKTESILIPVVHRVSVCRDSDDNRFLELALSGKASCIVSSDPDLLVLNPFENIPILTPNEFLEKF
jgi:putative PIN family toxin of toxin-antitoxin system